MAEFINSTPSSQEPRKRKRKPKKPEKPRPDFPLFPHQNGSWAKKIRGKLHHFGSWREDPNGEAALTKYLDQKDALHAGRTPRPHAEGLTIRDLVNRFLTSKRHLLDTHELAPRTFHDYYGVCERVIGVFGLSRLVDDLGPDDFERLRNDLAKRWGPVRLGNTIQRIRSLFKFGEESGLIAKRVLFGPGFKRPSRKVLRQERAKKGKQMFEADEIRKMLGEAGLQLRAMILLGINAGLGNSDCGALGIRHLDLDGGWLDYPRPKTAVDRRAKLWPETVEAIRNVLGKRKNPKDSDNDDLVFLTKFGAPWTKVRMTEEKDETKIKLFNDDAVSKETKKILLALDINGRRNFYCLRHTFETIAGDARDQVAVDHVMGHVRDDMASVYRERISDDRLVAVADHVRLWLFA
jgi:integrase